MAPELGSDEGTTATLSVPYDIAQAFVDSPVGLQLNAPFPVGTLHRGMMHVLAAWQAKFAPQVRKRNRKHRRKK